MAKRAGVGHDGGMPDPSNPFAVLEALLPPGHRPEAEARPPRGDRPQSGPRNRSPRPAPEPEGPPVPPQKLHEALRPGKAGFDALRYASWHGKASPLLVAYLELLAERFPSPHDQSFIKRAAERGELARGLMRRLAKLAKQHGAEAPELAEELGRAARSLSFWPGFPEAAKRLLAKVAAGEEDPVEGVGRYDRVEATWSQRRGRHAHGEGPAEEDTSEAKETHQSASENQAKAAKVKGDKAKIEHGPRPFVMTPFVRQKTGEHRVWNQSPSEAWVLHAAPGLAGWAGVLVPRPVSRDLPLAGEGIHLADADAAQLGQWMQELADGELAVLGVVKPGAEGLEALMAWAMRLLPLAGECKLEVIAAVPSFGPSVKAAGQAAVKALARTDAGRAKAIRLSAHPAKAHGGHLHASLLATLCFDAHPLAHQILSEHPWVGACLVGAPWPTRSVYDSLTAERMPSQDALTHFLAAAHRVTAGSLEALVSELLVDALRSDPKGRRHLADSATRHLRMGDDLLAIGRLIALLSAAEPQQNWPPALQLGALLARMESGEAEAGEAACQLAKNLLEEDARLACAAEVIRAELALASKDLDAAEAILAEWLAQPIAVPGLAQHLALHRTMALVQAARGDKEGALMRLNQAREQAQSLLDSSTREALLATLAMADAAIDPKVLAEDMALLVESEMLLAHGEQTIHAAALAMANALKAHPNAAAKLLAEDMALLVEGEALLAQGEVAIQEATLAMAELLDGAPLAKEPLGDEGMTLLVEGEALLAQGEVAIQEATLAMAEALDAASHAAEAVEPPSA